MNLLLDVTRSAPPVLPGSDAARSGPVDLGPLHQVLARLHAPRRSVRLGAARTVLAAPERFAPPALYALSHVLFGRGEREEALFWYHAGQLRTRFDIERCTDPTVADVLSRLRRQYGGAINEYAFVDAELEVLQAAVERAVAWDRATPHAYDHRWINLHGLRAHGLGATGLPLSRPRAQWPALAERVRTDYLDGTRALLGDLERGVPAPAPI